MLANYDSRFLVQVLRNHVFDNLVQNLAWNWHQVHQSLSHFPCSFKIKKKKKFPHSPYFIVGEGSFFPIADLRLQRGAPTFIITLWASFPYILAASPQGGLPYSSYQGVSLEFSIRKLTFSSISFLGSKEDVQAPGSLPLFVLKIQDLGRKEGLSLLNPPP